MARGRQRVTTEIISKHLESLPGGPNEVSCTFFRDETKHISLGELAFYRGEQRLTGTPYWTMQGLVADLVEAHLEKNVVPCSAGDSGAVTITNTAVGVRLVVNREVRVWTPVTTVQKHYSTK